MTALYWLDHEKQLIGHGRVFDPRHLAWIAVDQPVPATAEPVAPRGALARLGGHHLLRRVPIGVIGPRVATPANCQLAEDLGRALAENGLQMLCGGKTGVMEAACKGHAAAGGLPIGLLPDEEWPAANPYVAIPIATGIGPARNAIIARACLVLVAVGGGVGTLSEMALGLQFNRLVLAMGDAPVVDGVPRIATVEAVLECIARRLFKL